MGRYIVLYPRLSPADRATLAALRADHADPLRDAIAPHVTLVFASALSPDALAAEATRVASHTPPFSAIFSTTRTTDQHVQLLPDDPATFIALHDALYAGVLAPELRVDLPYVPHITLGLAPARVPPLHITATFDALDLLAFDGASIHPLSTIPLPEH